MNARLPRGRHHRGFFSTRFPHVASRPNRSFVFACCESASHTTVEPSVVDSAHQCQWWGEGTYQTPSLLVIRMHVGASAPFACMNREPSWSAHQTCTVLRIEAVHLTSFGRQTNHRCVTIVNIHHIAFTRAPAVLTANLYCYHEHYHVGARPV